MALLDYYATTIKQADYDGAIRQNCHRCLVARAVSRLIPKAHVSVYSPNGVRIDDRLFRITQGYNIIDEFDSGASSEVLVGRTLILHRA